MTNTARHAKCAIVVGLLAVLLNAPTTADANALDDWNAIASHTILVTANRGGTGNVDFAYVYIAIYDAVNAIDRGHTVFAVTPKPTTPTAGASLDAATAAAAYTVLKWLFPSQAADLTNTYNLYVSGLPAAGKADGIQVGTEVGDALIALRTDDGRNATVPYVFQYGPGQYELTPTPACPAPPLSPITPWLAQMRTFGIENSAQFRADGPPNLTSSQWADDYNETKAYGVLTGSLRTPDQTVNGQFFAENPGVQINRNISRVASDYHLSLVDGARFFAQVYVTIADAQMTTWNSKYFYNFWRPVTAIRAGDTDDNPATEPDPAWVPLVGTPCHPEYPAAHPTVTGAFAFAIEQFFGTKRVTVNLTSTSVPGSALTVVPFTNTDDIVKYVIAGRIFGGMHYRTSAVHGSVVARKTAHYISKHYFQPTE
jgi:hypothetical protein